MYFHLNMIEFEILSDIIGSENFAFSYVVHRKGESSLIMTSGLSNRY